MFSISFLHTQNQTDSCLKLNDVMGDNTSNLNASVPSDDKANYITMDDLNEGNYLRSSSPKESQIWSINALLKMQLFCISVFNKDD